MSNPVETSDHLLAQCLGPSLQAATIRLAAILLVASAVIALIVKLI